jgi:hypothetical protein
VRVAYWSRNSEAGRPQHGDAEVERRLGPRDRPRGRRDASPPGRYEHPAYAVSVRLRQQMPAVNPVVDGGALNVGGHSLRSGLVTTAVKRGVNLMKATAQDLISARIVLLTLSNHLPLGM